MSGAGRERGPAHTAGPSLVSSAVAGAYSPAS